MTVLNYAPQGKLNII